MKAVNIYEYVNSNQHNLKPPVSNVLLYNGKQLKVMIVGGPNERNDYHLNMGEELFIQLRGGIKLNVHEPNLSINEEIPIDNGEIFLLPYCIPHSPQRFTNTIGLVFERTRLSNELDGLRWYNEKDKNNTILYEKFFKCYDLGTQIKEAILDFRNSSAYETNKPLLNYNEDSEYVEIHNDFLNKLSHLKNPINFQPISLLNEYENLDKYPFGVNCILNGEEFQVDLVVGNLSNYNLTTVNQGEIFLWQMKGSATISEDSSSSTLNLNDILIFSYDTNNEYLLSNHSKDDRTLIVKNKVDV